MGKGISRWTVAEGVDGQLSEEVRVTSGVPQWSLLGSLLFFAYVNYIWRNAGPNIRLFADDCVIYRKIMNSIDIDKLQTGINRVWEWTVRSEMKINTGKDKAVKDKAVSFTKARVKE
jgi:hypothetical protein